MTTLVEDMAAFRRAEHRIKTFIVRYRMEPRLDEAAESSLNPNNIIAALRLPAYDPPRGMFVCKDADLCDVAVVRDLAEGFRWLYRKLLREYQQALANLNAHGVDTGWKDATYTLAQQLPNGQLKTIATGKFREEAK